MNGTVIPFCCRCQSFCAIFLALSPSNNPSTLGMILAGEREYCARSTSSPFLQRERMLGAHTFPFAAATHPPSKFVVLSSHFLIAFVLQTLLLRLPVCIDSHIPRPTVALARHPLLISAERKNPYKCIFQQLLSRCINARTLDWLRMGSGTFTLCAISAAIRHCGFKRFCRAICVQAKTPFGLFM